MEGRMMGVVIGPGKKKSKPAAAKEAPRAAAQTAPNPLAEPVS